MKQRGLGGFPHERLLNPEGATHSVGVVTQITATMRLSSGWSGQYSLFDYSCKLSPFRAGLLTNHHQQRTQSIEIDADAEFPVLNAD